MKKIQVKMLLLLCFAIAAKAQGQNRTKAYLEQGLEYYFVTNKYDQALKTLETLQKNHNLKSVKLDYALNVAVKFKRNDLIVPLLEEDFSDFNVDLASTNANVGEFLKDSTFTFEGYFGKNWPTIHKLLEQKRQQYEDNLKSDYYGMLNDFMSVDQFVRFNSVSLSTFNEVDSLNLDNFVNWLVEVPEKEYRKSRLNNQILQVLLRHIGPARFRLLTEKQVFTRLLDREILSAQDYGLMCDYIHDKGIYFVAIDGFIEKDWAFSGIKTQADLKAVDQQRATIGLLPLEYSSFCIQRNLVVPADLKYAPAVETMVFARK